ncbi:MAG TPA: hypothetical protein VF951_10795, partial [Streptosporangiaceae bacterium]
MTSEPATRTPTERAYAGIDTSRQAWWRRAMRWESGLVVVLAATLIFGTVRSSAFLNTSTLFYVGLNMGEIAISNSAPAMASFQNEETRLATKAWLMVLSSSAPSAAPTTVPLPP